MRDWRAKLDHRLRVLLDRRQPDDAENDGQVGVFVRFRGTVDDLIACGLVVRSLAGDIASATLPLSKIESAAMSPAVLFIELARPLSDAEG